MKPGDFLKMQLKKKEKHFFSQISLYRFQKKRIQKENHSWAANGYKIYPSQLTSINMCPKRLIEEDVHKPFDVPLPTQYKMEYAKAIHKMIQDEALDITEEMMNTLAQDIGETYAELIDTYVRNMYKTDAISDKSLLYAKPNIVCPISSAKLLQHWPEVPVWYEPCGLSGRSRCCYRRRK